MAAIPTELGNNTSVTVAYAAALLDYLRANNVDAESLFTPAQLKLLSDKDPQKVIKLSFWVEMLESASVALNQPSLPLLVGQTMGAKNIGVLAYVGMSCLTLGEAIEHAARYMKIVGNMSRMCLRTCGETAEVPWIWPHDGTPPQCVAEVHMAVRLNSARVFTGRPDLYCDTYFQFPAPADISPYKLMFGGDCYFGAVDTKLVFPKEYLSLPMIAANASMRETISGQAQAILNQREGTPPLVKTVQGLLLDGLSTNQTSINVVAESMEISTRSLQRKLSEHGFKFQDILDNVRSDRAKQLLLQTPMQLAEVAFLLGYSEQSSFQNAFKRWTGKTPEVWRQTER
jgi:AraC-like DNA-binding protein